MSPCLEENSVIEELEDHVPEKIVDDTLYMKKFTFSENIIIKF
jgi:hypothetical protein